jgi:hypothetical protein
MGWNDRMGLYTDEQIERYLDVVVARALSERDEARLSAVHSAPGGEAASPLSRSESTPPPWPEPDPED